LERSLFQQLIGPRKSLNLGTAGIRLNFHNTNCGSSSYLFKRAVWQGSLERDIPGTVLKPFVETEVGARTNLAEISLIKLHGSLNFPREGAMPHNWSPVVALPDPAIVPPVFNKAASTFTSPVWAAGLEALRRCKNIIICGYSLPTTDTYMQYFLKAALGPNRSLNRIYVFDPSLFKDGREGESLKMRYAECFAEAFRDRIEFKPAPFFGEGTFEHFTSVLQNSASSILFGIDR
jgi:hypothetical protein